MAGIKQRTALLGAIRRKGICFQALYPILKECFPVSDAVLAEMLAVAPNHVYMWKTGRWQPRNGSMRFAVFLALWRVGLVSSAVDVASIGLLAASGKLDKLVLERLAAEELAEEQRTGRKRRPKPAIRVKLKPAGETKVDISTVLEPKKP